MSSYPVNYRKKGRGGLLQRGQIAGRTAVADFLGGGIANVNYTYVLSVEGEKEYVDFLTKLKYIKVEDLQIFVDRFMRPDFVKEIMKR